MLFLKRVNIRIKFQIRTSWVSKMTYLPYTETFIRDRRSLDYALILCVHT